VRALCVTFDEPLDWTAFGIWLTMLLQARGEDVLRVKGLLDVGTDGPLVLNGVQHVVHPPEHLPQWPDEDRRSRVVFIGRGLEQQALEDSLAAFNRSVRPL
jgi:G3E family GTPase